jgi:hypothetical protein
MWWVISLVLAFTPQLAEGGFVYTTCKKGFEKLLKCEIQTLNPTLKFAFSRPGLITWKQPEDAAFDSFDSSGSIFMRSHGQSVSAQAVTAADVVNAASDLGIKKSLRLHVWGREEEPGLKSEHPQVTLDRTARVEKLKSDLLQQLETTTSISFFEAGAVPGRRE